MKNIKTTNEKKIFKGVFVSQQLNNVVKFNNLNFNAWIRHKLRDALESGELKMPTEGYIPE